MPTARIAHAVTTGLNGCTYAIGGFDVNLSSLATVDVYCPRTGQWTEAAPLPAARALLAAATTRDGRILALGGQESLFTGAVATVDAYTPSTNTWTALAPMPTARSRFGAVTGPDGRIYVIGGSTTGGGATDSVEAYSPDTNTWTTLAPLPTPRAGLGAALGPDGRIYAIGGVTANGTSNAVEAYTPNTNTWASAAPLPVAAYGVYNGVATGADGRLYVFGGYSAEPICNETLIKNILVYSPSLNSWQMLPWPFSRYQPSVALGGDNRVYVTGGSTGPGSCAGVTAEVESYKTLG